MKKKLNLILLICAFSFINCCELFAQRTVQAPEFVNNFGPLSTVCSEPGDVFTVVAVLSPGDALPSDNQFILELSDTTGGFDSPVELARANGPNNGTSIEQDIRFENVQIPEGTGSENYRIRVVTSSTGIPSASSDPIPIYYYRNDLSLRINNTQNVILCNVTNFVRTISITATDIDDGSDVNPDDFEYQWFRGGFPGGTLIPNETGSSLDVTQNDLDASGVAVFYAQINLGACNPQFPSSRTNNLTVQLIDPDDVSILEGPSINFCPQDTNKTLNSSITDFRNSYQWFKDDVLIEGATDTSYDLPDNNFDGMYTLQVTYSEDCTLTTAPARVINDGSTITVPLLENIIILPQETITLEVTTDAPVSPATSTFQWFRDTSPLTGILTLTEPTVSIDIGNPGTYGIDILADDSCLSMLNSNTNVYSPVAIGLEIGPSDDFTCEDSSITLEIKDMFGFTQSGSGAPPQISLTPNQYDLFNFEWFKDDQPTGITTTTLDVDTSEENANYTLRADLITGEFTDIVSNILTLTTIPSNIEIQASSTTIPDSGSVVLSVIQNPNYSYEWFRVVDGVEELISDSAGNTITVTEEGVYFVRISSGICSFDTPTVTIGTPVGVSEIIPNVITPFGSAGQNDTWILPSSLANQQDVEVTIYDTRGQVDFIGVGYQNNWPLENSRSSGQNPIYYYIITKNNSVVRKGSITVMR
ncbi:gliding motility-associated C-terminal domain-containing protein [Aquimarina gracilis]|uniref:Gliding motility-associated C-terminal domain-containing protein n=1 Tax=Aquimarina gracilis TaxID=874422 RepID=A0ABU6A108_9FLAO|nr:gliding motility-associated C-terminal domain-containing protein [Aquimarina gracilis]MEB3347781.1 gliding motility-associated C-terminal domain-containing protein [Aquimarina gracilis]